jgi:hypothetical protein
MEEYIINTQSKSEIVKEPLPNAEWKLVMVYIGSPYPIEVFLCKVGEKTFIKPSGLICHNNGNPCPGVNYGYHDGTWYNVYLHTAKICLKIG